MFDDVKKEPEDMFAEADKLAPQVTAPTQPAQAPAPQGPVPQAASPQAQPPATDSLESRVTNAYTQKKSPVKMIVIILTIVVVIAGAFFISMRMLSSQTDVVPSQPVLTGSAGDEGFIADTAVEENTPVVEVPDVEEIEPVVEVDPIETDSDKDGLTDTQEVELGTNPFKSDSDGDGLFDLEEVQVYKTNPNNPDSDGDTFSDGAEVEGGYNPAGPGKLLELPGETK